MAETSTPKALSARTDALELRRLANLVRSAKAKDAAGKRVSREESAAVRKYERIQTETIGRRYFHAMRKGEVLEHLGTSSKVATDNRERRGFPWPVGKRDTVDGRELLRFLWRFYLDNPGASGNGEDIAGQELKDEYVRLQIEEKECVIEKRRIELEAQVASYRPAELYDTTLSELAAIIRKKRGDLARRFDGADKDRIERAFDDMADDFVRAIEDNLGEEDIGDNPPTEPTDQEEAA